MKPTYIILGTQKGGTESMMVHFQQHPDIYIHRKEIQFFNNESYFINNSCNIQIYEKHFKTDKKIIGEKTPSYMYVRNVIDRIQQYYPDIKLIMLLREPIQRAYSQYNMKEKRNNYKTSFIDLIKEKEHIKVEDILTNDYDSYFLQRGFYVDQIEYIYSKFPRENIYIGISEEVLQNPLEEYNKVFQFLGTSLLESIRFNPNVHKGKYACELSQEDRAYLYNLYKPYNERLYAFLGRKIESWERYYKAHGLVT